MTSERSMRTPCGALGRKHQWRERIETFNPWSSQAVGSFWLCALCGATSDWKPTD